MDELFMKIYPYVYYNCTEWRTDCGKLHREDGPAYITLDGVYMAYYQNAELHRMDGPSTIHIPDNTSVKNYTWFVRGKSFTTIMNQWIVEMGIDLDNLTEDDKLVISMKMGGFNA